MYKLKNVKNLTEAETIVAEITQSLEQRFFLAELKLQQWGTKAVIYEARPKWNREQDFLVEVQLSTMDVYAKVVGDDFWVPLGALTHLAK